MTEFTDAELEAFLDESLDPQRAEEIETAIVEDRELLQRLSHINGRRDAGMHTLGEIWRRNQVGVPTPDHLGKYLLGILTDEEACLLYTSPSPRDRTRSRMPSSA